MVVLSRTRKTPPSRSASSRSVASWRDMGPKYQLVHSTRVREREREREKEKNRIIETRHTCIHRVGALVKISLLFFFLISEDEKNVSWCRPADRKVKRFTIFSPLLCPSRCLGGTRRENGARPSSFGARRVNETTKEEDVIKKAKGPEIVSPPFRWRAAAHPAVSKWLLRLGSSHFLCHTHETSEKRPWQSTREPLAVLP